MIIIVEPQCIGDLHEMVNASFLYGMCREKCSDKIIFYADNSHQKCVKDILDKNNLFPENLEFIPVDIPKGGIFRLSKFFLYFRLFYRILSSASKFKVDTIIFFSIYSYNLIILKILLKYRYPGLFRIKIIIHGILEQIRIPTSHFLLNRIQNIKYALMLYPDLDLQYIVLSPSILKNLIIHSPCLSKNFIAIHLPYLYNNTQCILPKSEPLVFATIGKGNPFFIKQIANRILDERLSNQSCEFWIIGNNCGNLYHDSYGRRFVQTISYLKKNVKDGTWIKKIIELPVSIRSYFHPIQEPENQNLKCVSGGRKLSRNEMDHYLKDVDYILFFYHQNTYKLTASGSFFDAISYKKPMIFLGNDFFDFYFSRYRIGYRAETVNEITGIIKRIIEDNGEFEIYNGFLREIGRFREEINIESELKKLSSE